MIPQQLMVVQIAETVAVRRDPDFVIIAWINALRAKAATRRCAEDEAYQRAGADIL